jgi:hypothetical protein
MIPVYTITHKTTSLTHGKIYVYQNHKLIFVKTWTNPKTIDLIKSEIRSIIQNRYGNVIELRTA